jgi:hypothetical protein
MTARQFDRRSACAFSDTSGRIVELAFFAVFARRADFLLPERNSAGNSNFWMPWSVFFMQAPSRICDGLHGASRVRVSFSFTILSYKYESLVT